VNGILTQDDPSRITDTTSGLNVRHLNDNSAQIGRKLGQSDDRETGQATDPTAVAGKDGEEFARLIRQSQQKGSALLWRLVRDGLQQYTGGPLLAPHQLDQLTESFATLRSVGDLMGRTRIREQHDYVLRSNLLSKFSEHIPFVRMSDQFSVVGTPEQALDYFTGLEPRLGVDPERYPDEQRRRAFTLAVATNETLTRRVQQEIASGIKRGESTADVTARIQAAIDESGVKPKTKDYAMMVVRTNMNEAYQTGAWEEGQHPDVRDLFPVYQYLGIRDGRQGKDHETKFGKYYPGSIPFAQVRGPRVFNCRCNLKYVDMFDWDQLREHGAREETEW
jgi:Phage Mu protein F like protein